MSIKKVYVKWNPLHERVVCVHLFDDDECPKCIKEKEELKNTPYYLKGEWQTIYNGRMSSDTLIKHEDIYELFVEGELPEEDFNFIATDGKTYTFKYDRFEYLLSDLRRDDVTDLITTNNGSIERMVDIGLAKLLK